MYGDLYQGPLAPELSTAEEVETLARLFADAQGPVLDVGCGHGRHLAGLRKSGVDCIGIDYSMELLALTPKRARKSLIRGKMQTLPFRSASLSGAYMLFNTFGYFADDENAATLLELARTLRKGATLVLDIPARAGMKRAVAELPSSMRCQDDVSIIESWTIDDSEKRLLARGRWDVKGEKQDWEMSLRLYTPAEIRRLLKKAGFGGEIEVRPLEDFEILGSDEAPPGDGDSLWRSTTNMVVRAVR